MRKYGVNELCICQNSVNWVESCHKIWKESSILYWRNKRSNTIIIEDKKRKEKKKNLPKTWKTRLGESSTIFFSQRIKT